MNNSNNRNFQIITTIILILVMIISIYAGAFVINEGHNNNTNNDSNKMNPENNEPNPHGNNDVLSNPDLPENDQNNGHDNFITKDGSNFVLTSRSTFIKRSIGDSSIKIEVSKTTNAQISFITDECNIDEGYAIIILSKGSNTSQGAKFYETLMFWKQDELLFDNIETSQRNVQMKDGIYDLFIASSFGTWGITIETDLLGIEYEYETPITSGGLFEAIEFEQEINNISPFVNEILFKDTYFDINSSGFLYRFFQLSAELEGYGIEDIDVETEIFDPDGESCSGGGDGTMSFYKDTKDYTRGYLQTDVIYPYDGKWMGNGKCTIKTRGVPNLENYDVHMFEFIINF